MKQLTCEMCGSTEMIKNEGMFVCQVCGTKYSVEEAKKMMIEGTVDVSGSTVKIDNSERLKNLYRVARQARDSNDAVNAVKYYSQIKVEDPQSWEASFYDIYFRATQCRIFQIKSTAHSLMNTISTPLTAALQLPNQNEMVSAVSEITVRIIGLCVVLNDSAKNHYTESFNNAFGKYTDSGRDCEKYFNEYMDAANEIAFLAKGLGGAIEAGSKVLKQHSKISENSIKKLAALSAECWKCFINVYGPFSYLFDSRIRSNAMLKEHERKIQAVEPSYRLGRPNTQGFPAFTANAINQNYNKDHSSSYNYNKSTTQPTKTTQSSNTAAQNNNSTGGCYVATAVYGSYDCPQVWTLRRYRDNVLAETWYGRAFIRTYYAVSPTIVKWFGDTVWFKKMWQDKLDRMVENLNSQGVEDTPYDDKQW